MMRKTLWVCFVCLLLVSCSNGSFSGFPSDPASIPAFDHVVIIVLENRSFEAVMGNTEMPYLNQLAAENVLLDQYYATRHPSLPNYLALIGGGTFGVRKNCTDCFVNRQSLPDRIEEAGLTWKTYQEDLPSPCFLGDQGRYMQKHNPFVYFDPIRLNPERCQRSVVPMTEMERDLAENTLPNFVFISPNMCHSGHDCTDADVDQWLEQVVEPLKRSPALGENSLIVITYDEASRKDDQRLIRLSDADGRSGGRVVTVLISPQAQAGTVDSTPLTHYSLLKTILEAWDLPGVGITNEPRIRPITAPWGVGDSSLSQLPDPSP